MITPDYKQIEITNLWAKILDLHSGMKLGNEITHLMREQVASISKELFDIGKDLKECRIYVPSVASEGRKQRPALALDNPLHPTTNPNGDKSA